MIFRHAQSYCNIFICTASRHLPTFSFYNNFNFTKIVTCICMFWSAHPKHQISIMNITIMYFLCYPNHSHFECIYSISLVEIFLCFNTKKRTRQSWSKEFLEGSIINSNLFIYVCQNIISEKKGSLGTTARHECCSSLPNDNSWSHF